MKLGVRRRDAERWPARKMEAGKNRGGKYKLRKFVFHFWNEFDDPGSMTSSLG